MSTILRFLIPRNFPTQINYNIGFLLLRFFVGLAFCTVFEKLFPKEGVWGPQDWFISDVQEMGFPAPLLFAWLAVLTEFVGGILLMLGLFTRPAALLNVFVTFTAAFIYHEGDIVEPGLLAFFFMIMCLSIVLNGPGKYSLDYLIHKKYIKMKSVNAIIVLLMVSQSCFSQSPTVTSYDFEKIATNWTGTLTYTDYSDDNTQTTLNCTLDAEWTGTAGNFHVGFQEPSGMMIYDKAKMKILNGGKNLKYDGMKYQVDQMNKEENSENWIMVLSSPGKDNNLNARIRLSIEYNTNTLTMTKEVKYENQSEYFVRNKYSFERVN